MLPLLAVTDSEKARFLVAMPPTGCAEITGVVSMASVATLLVTVPHAQQSKNRVGVVNVQTVRARSFTPAEQSYISVVAGLIRACLRLRDRVRDVPVEPPPDGR